MHVLRCLLLSMAMAGPALAGPPEGSKDDLLTLYLLSISADRCGFAMTAKQADLIERESRDMAERLKLKARETDAIFSEADMQFEKQGPKVCDRDGRFAKGFRETLQRLTGP